LVGKAESDVDSCGDSLRCRNRSITVRSSIKSILALLVIIWIANSISNILASGALWAALAISLDPTEFRAVWSGTKNGVAKVDSLADWTATEIGRNSGCSLRAGGACNVGGARWPDFTRWAALSITNYQFVASRAHSNFVCTSDSVTRNNSLTELAALVRGDLSSIRATSRRNWGRASISSAYNDRNACWAALAWNSL